MYKRRLLARGPSPNNTAAPVWPSHNEVRPRRRALSTSQCPGVRSWVPRSCNRWIVGIGRAPYGPRCKLARTRNCLACRSAVRRIIPHRQMQPSTRLPSCRRPRLDARRSELHDAGLDPVGAGGAAGSNDLELRRRELRRARVSVDEHPDRVRRCGRQTVNLEGAQQNPRRCPKCTASCSRSARCGSCDSTTCATRRPRCCSCRAPTWRPCSGSCGTRIRGSRLRSTGTSRPVTSKKEIDRLRFEPLPAHPSDTGASVQAASAAASAAGSGPSNGPSDPAAGALAERAWTRSSRRRRVGLRCPVSRLFGRLSEDNDVARFVESVCARRAHARIVLKLVRRRGAAIAGRLIHGHERIQSQTTLDAGAEHR